MPHRTQIIITESKIQNPAELEKKKKKNMPIKLFQNCYDFGILPQNAAEMHSLQKLNTGQVT